MSDTEDHDTSQQPLVSKDGEVKDKPPDQHPGSPNEADGDIVDTEDGEIDRYTNVLHNVIKQNRFVLYRIE